MDIELTQVDICVHVNILTTLLFFIVYAYAVHGFWRWGNRLLEHAWRKWTKQHETQTLKGNLVKKQTLNNPKSRTETTMWHCIRFSTLSLLMFFLWSPWDQGTQCHRSPVLQGECSVSAGWELCCNFTRRRSDGGRSYYVGPCAGKTVDPTWPSTVTAEGRDPRAYSLLHGI